MLNRFATVLMFCVGLSPFICMKALVASNLEPLQKALSQYDPIIQKNIELHGKLHFPEVERRLPDFYKQLFQRVFIQLTVGRNKFELEIGGKSEQMKELVRQHFLRIEEKLKGEFLEVMENDPVFRLKNVRNHPTAYSAVIHERPASKEYHFNIRVGLGKEGKNLPKSVMFELSEKGRLKKMVVEDQRSVAEFIFLTEVVKEKFYIKRIDIIYKRHGIKKYRKLDVKYRVKKGIRFPQRLVMSELDSQGKLLIVPGHLNPVSMVFNDVKVLDVKED